MTTSIRGSKSALLAAAATAIYPVCFASTLALSKPECSDRMSPNSSGDIRVLFRNPDDFRKKLKQIKNNGPKHLKVVADFDFTLTKVNEESQHFLLYPFPRIIAHLFLAVLAERASRSQLSQSH